MSKSKTVDFSTGEISPLVFRSAYSPKLKLSLSFPESEGPHGRTKQSFKDECDVNRIMAKFQKTGLIDFVNRRQAQYADVSGVSFEAAMDVVAKGTSMFAELPAAVRDRFQNDPAKFLDFVNNPNNIPEMKEMGLVTYTEVPEPSPSPQATPVAGLPPEPRSDDSGKA